MATTDDASLIARAIDNLTTELREVRIALNSINELFEDVIDKSANTLPGYIRIRQIE